MILVETFEVVISDGVEIINFSLIFGIPKAKLIIRLENEMKEAAKNLDFERAMELRDILFELKSE